MEYLLWVIFKYCLIICAILAGLLVIVLLVARLRGIDLDADYSQDANEGDAGYPEYEGGMTEDQRQEEEKMAEAFICPVCFEPYDGVYCETCGYSNDGDEFDDGEIFGDLI